MVVRVAFHFGQGGLGWLVAGDLMANQRDQAAHAGPGVLAGFAAESLQGLGGQQVAAVMAAGSIGPIWSPQRVRGAIVPSPTHATTSTPARKAVVTRPEPGRRR